MDCGQIELGTFRLAGSLPAEVPVTLLSAQGKPANEVWSCDGWKSLCLHLHNLNGETQFVIGSRIGGEKQYVKSKKFEVSKIISWSWDSIIGRAKTKAAFVPYSQNKVRKSRWGGLDFDAHCGEAERARRFAFEAFRLLLNVEGLFIVLETTGSGGWHVWAVSKDFHEVSNWVWLLKWVAGRIGATIESGICEIFPPEKAAEMEFGKGIRAPGCWNPGTDTLSEIHWHNTEPLLRELLKDVPERERHFPEIKKVVSFSVSSSEDKDLYPPWFSDWRHTFRIERPSSRNDSLIRLTANMFHQVGYRMAGWIARAHYAEKQVSTRATLERHLKDFRSAWTGLHKEWLALLSDREREVLQSLSTEHERDAFRIVRSFARKAALDEAEDFPIVRDNLGDRLGISGRGAGGVRDKLEKLGIIKCTKGYVPNKAAARYRWELGAIGHPATMHNRLKSRHRHARRHSLLSWK
jgi:hypothetical protein